MKIGLLYGTETGNAELLCDDIEAEIGSSHDCSIASLADIAPSDLRADTFYIFVVSTYGNGDLPSGAAKFFEELDAEKPDLSKVSFAIFGLGDMVFDYTFAQGSEKLAALLVECKARMIGERGIHDASSPDMPEDIGLPWVEVILSEMLVEAA